MTHGGCYDTRMRIVIAGGGLVGLTLAGLLRRRGAEPVVLERMRPGDYVRRGFMLGHQGYAALDELGIMDGLRTRSGTQTGHLLPRPPV